MFCRLKRVHVFLLGVGMFFIWNVLTYYTLVNRMAIKDVQEEDGLESALSHLQTQISSQVEKNKKLLDYLQELVHIREQLKAKKFAEREMNLSSDAKKQVLPVLMIACDRITVSRSLDLLLKYRPSAEKFPIMVSQDCGHAETAAVIQSYITKNTSHFIHIKHPDLSDISLSWPQKKFAGYYKIARHYKWALNQIFRHFNFSTVIIVEDDLEVSPDFFEYFSATCPLLQADPTLWCVSAWNDNGKSSLISDESEKLYRTDFFPGLGWMIRQEVWLELDSKWPETFWDDWMRHPDQRKDRQCIRPEICRTSTFGKKGVSKGLYFEKHLQFIKLNDKFVPFSKMNLSYLLKDHYDNEFMKTVNSATVLSITDVTNLMQPEQKVVRVQYNNKDEFKNYAKQLGIMDDFKAGIPRAAYKGVISCMYKGRRVYLTPPVDWAGYDMKWT